MIRSLRRKFIAVTMAIVTVLLCVIFGLVIHSTAENLEYESLRQLRRAAELDLPEPPDDPPPGQERLPCFVIRISAFGQTVIRTGGFDLGDEMMLDAIVTAAADSGSESGVIGEYSLRFVRLERPHGLTLAFADITSEETTLKGLVLNCVAIGFLSLLVFWCLSILLARWAVKPVERAWQEQRQFIADASHELKTPLTVILTNAELLRDAGEAESQYARSILTMSQRMRSLVESLLELARVDNGAARADHHDVDLSKLTEEELLPYEPLFFEQGLTLESDITEDLHITGSPLHLRQLLGVLLDNALKYTSPAGTVRLRLSRQGSNALLTVSNPGETLSREECRSIFRRFYRTDKARSAGGYGLGLAIAQGIATDHGGRIWAESREGLVTLSVQLPLKRSEP